MASLSEPLTLQGPGPGKSNLELLPTELLTVVFGQLSQNDLQSYLDLQDESVVKTNRIAHSTMRSLCLTSKRIDCVARPLLYKNITIASPKQLLLLYETLQESPQLGCHIRQLSFEILLGAVKLDDFLPLPSARSANLLVDWEEPTPRLSSNSFPTYACDQILSCAYFEILCRTSNLHQLVLRMQEIDFYRHQGEHQDFDFMYQPLFRKVKDARKSATGGTTFLPRLKNLQLLGGPNTNCGFAFDYRPCTPLTRLCTLENITISHAWLCFLHEEAQSPDYRKPDDPWPGLEAIKVAELQDCIYGNMEFSELNTFLPNLEILKLSIPMDDRYDSYSSDISDDHHRFEDLQEALSHMLDLHTLILEISFNPERAEYFEDVLEECLNLASLPKLATVKVPLPVLVKKQGTTGEMKDRLEHILPKSLERLTVTVEVFCQEHWFNGEIFGLFGLTSTSSSTILEFLWALSELGSKVFPRLQEVVCCYTMKPYRPRHVRPIQGVGTLSADLDDTDLFELDDDSSRRLEQLRASILHQDIHFRVEYEELCCNCN